MWDLVIHPLHTASCTHHNRCCPWYPSPIVFYILGVETLQTLGWVCVYSDNYGNPHKIWVFWGWWVLREHRVQKKLQAHTYFLRPCLLRNEVNVGGITRRVFVLSLCRTSDELLFCHFPSVCCIRWRENKITYETEWPSLRPSLPFLVIFSIMPSKRGLQSTEFIFWKNSWGLALLRSKNYRKIA